MVAMSDDDADLYCMGDVFTFPGKKTCDPSRRILQLLGLGYVSYFCRGRDNPRVYY